MKCISAVVSMFMLLAATSFATTAAPLSGPQKRVLPVTGPHPFTFLLKLNVDLTGVTNVVGPNAIVAAQPVSAWVVECLIVSTDGTKQLNSLSKTYHATKLNETDSVVAQPELTWKNNPQYVPAKFYCNLYALEKSGFLGSMSGYDLGASHLKASGPVSDVPPYEVPVTLSVVPQARFLHTPVPKIK